MFCSPWIINRIGAKNTLLIAGLIMATRIIGSSFATTAVDKQLVMEGSRRFLKPLNPAWPEPIIELGTDAMICGVVFSKLEIF